MSEEPAEVGVHRLDVRAFPDPPVQPGYGVSVPEVVDAGRVAPGMRGLGKRIPELVEPPVRRVPREEAALAVGEERRSAREHGLDRVVVGSADAQHVVAHVDRPAAPALAALDVDAPGLEVDPVGVEQQRLGRAHPAAARHPGRRRNHVLLGRGACGRTA